MSTLITQTELLKVPSSPAKMTNEDHIKGMKRDRFVRSSSIEKIIKFNTYICSQNYFILPAILTWLKTSQSVLYTNLEKIIFFMKSLFFNSLAYKILESKVELVAPSVKQALNTSVQCFAHYRDTIRLEVKETATNVQKRVNEIGGVLMQKLFLVAVYSTIFIIFAQAVACVGVLSSVLVTGGPIFLCACMSCMSYVYLRILLDHPRRSDEMMEKKCDTVKPKNMLMKLDNSRTLSSLNLL